MSDPSPADVDAMSEGNLYHYLLDKDQFEWARVANRRSKLGLSPLAEEALASWFASAMCAVDDRPNADYIRARLESGG